MRRRGQALLVVFGVTLAVLIIVSVSYLLVRMFVGENSIVRSLNNYETAFNSYTSQVDTNIMSFTGSVVPVLGSRVSVNCTGVPFLPAYEDYAHYRLAPPDYYEKFAKCDIRGAYLTRLAELILSRVGNLTTGNFSAEIGSVPLSSAVRSDPYFFVYSGSNDTASILFISNGSKFTVFIPNLTTSFDPGVEVCYSFKRQQTYLGRCSKPVADYLRLRDEHQLKFSVDARPVYLYDYLAYRYAIWNTTLHRDFDDKALVIPVDLSTSAVRSVIFHADPLSEIIPPSMIGHWVSVSNLRTLFGENVGIPVYYGRSVPSDYGREQQYISITEVNETYDPSALIDLIAYPVFYPSFEVVKGAYNEYKPELFASDNCSSQVAYLPVCAFNDVMNYHFVSRSSPLANPDEYTNTNYDTMFSNVLKSGTVFHSVVGSYIEAESGGLDGIRKDYVKYFERLALSYMASTGYPFDVKNYGGVSLGISYFFRPGTDGFNSLLRPERWFAGKSVYGDTILGIGYPVVVYGNGASTPEDSNVTVYTTGLGLSMFFFTLLDNSGGVFSPFYTTNPGAGEINGLKLGGYSLRQILGSSVNLTNFNGFWASLPAIDSLEFRIHDVRVDYFYTMNLSNAVKVMIRKWKSYARAVWVGTPNGNCICYIGNKTYNCTDYSNPSWASGVTSGVIDAPVTGLDGSFSYKNAPEELQFETDVDIKHFHVHISILNGETAGNNSTSEIGLEWRLYEINGLPGGYDSQYVFLRRGYPTIILAGCDNDIGSAGAPVYAEKVFVGVRQVYNVSAVLSMKVDFKISGKLYGVDYYTLKRVLERFFNVSGFDYDTAVGSVLDYWINGEEYSASKIGADISEILNGGQYRPTMTVLIPPELIFSSNLYVKIPFTATIMNFPVVILYKFLYGYPGKIDNVDTVTSPNNLNSLSYNWFDITKDIPLRDIITDDTADIKRVALSLVKNIADGSIAFPFLETPTRGGGYYTSITPPGFPGKAHIHIVFVGSLDKTKVIETYG